MAITTIRPPRAPKAATLPTKTRKRGRPPKAKVDLSSLRAALTAQDADQLFWALAEAIVHHTEYCHPGTRDHVAGLGSLTALLKSKLAKPPEPSEADQDLDKVARTIQSWMPNVPVGSPCGPASAHL